MNKTTTCLDKLRKIIREDACHNGGNRKITCLYLSPVDWERFRQEINELWQVPLDDKREIKFMGIPIKRVI